MSLGSPLNTPLNIIYILDISRETLKIVIRVIIKSPLHTEHNQPRGGGDRAVTLPLLNARGTKDHRPLGSASLRIDICTLKRFCIDLKGQLNSFFYVETLNKYRKFNSTEPLSSGLSRLLTLKRNFQVGKN